jgi:hypothetical protein
MNGEDLHEFLRDSRDPFRQCDVPSVMLLTTPVFHFLSRLAHDPGSCSAFSSYNPESKIKLPRFDLDGMLALFRGHINPNWSCMNESMIHSCIVDLNLG